MYKATIETAEIKKSDWREFIDAILETAPPDIRKVDWDEVDEAGQVIAQGGICTDSECDCHGSWVHWSDELWRHRSHVARYGPTRVGFF